MLFCLQAKPEDLPCAVGHARLSLTTHYQPALAAVTDPEASDPLPALAATILAGVTAGASPQSDTAAGPVTVQQGAPARMEEEWVVCNALGGGAARDMAVKAAGSSGVKMIPWVGVAALLPSTDASGHAVTVRAEEAGGRAFCFLPLPVTTGLPLHVNAFFELSSNRRDIWWVWVAHLHNWYGGHVTQH
jgi:hypothetical protein